MTFKDNTEKMSMSLAYNEMNQMESFIQQRVPYEIQCQYGDWCLRVKVMCTSDLPRVYS